MDIVLDMAGLILEDLFNLKGHETEGVSEHFQVVLSQYKANSIGLLYFKLTPYFRITVLLKFALKKYKIIVQNIWL